jgi:hypothetical protein
MVNPPRFYRWLITNNFPDDFQILCHNCNYAKSHGGCPHKRSALLAMIAKVSRCA